MGEGHAGARTRLHYNDLKSLDRADEYNTWAKWRRKPAFTGIF